MNLFSPTRPTNPIGIPLLSPRQISPYFTITPRPDGTYEISCLLEKGEAWYRHSALVDDLNLFFTSYMDNPEETMELAFGWKTEGIKEDELSLEDFEI